MGLVVTIGANLSSFERKMKKATKDITYLSKKMQNIGKSMTFGLTMPIIAVGGAATKLGMDLEETMNKIDVVFEDSAEKVKKWSKTSIQSMGLASQTALDSAALFGDMATGMGFTEGAAADMSMNLTQLSADLASFKNIKQDVAETALKSIFTGETESMKNLGIVMTQANLQQFAYSKGINKNIKDMTEAEKVQLRYAYVVEKTQKAQGDFARTGAGSANQTRMFTENLKQLGTQIGSIILPTFNKVITKSNAWAIKFSSLDERTKKIIVALALVVAAIGPVILLIGKTIAGIKTLIVVYGVLKKAVTNFKMPKFNPWVIGIAAVITIAVILIKYWNEVKATAVAVTNVVKSAWEWLGLSIKKIWNIAMNFIFERLKKMLDKIEPIVKILPKGIQDAFGKLQDKVSNTVDKTEENLDTLKYAFVDNSERMQTSVEGVKEALSMFRKQSEETSEDVSTYSSDMTDDVILNNEDVISSLKDTSSVISGTWSNTAESVGNSIDKIKNKLMELMGFSSNNELINYKKSSLDVISSALKNKNISTDYARSIAQSILNTGTKLQKMPEWLDTSGYNKKIDDYEATKSNTSITQYNTVQVNDTKEANDFILENALATP